MDMLYIKKILYSRIGVPLIDTKISKSEHLNEEKVFKSGLDSDETMANLWFRYQFACKYKVTRWIIREMK